MQTTGCLTGTILLLILILAERGNANSAASGKQNDISAF